MFKLVWKIESVKFIDSKKDGKKKAASFDLRISNNEETGLINYIDVFKLKDFNLVAGDEVEVTGAIWFRTYNWKDYPTFSAREVKKTWNNLIAGAKEIFSNTKNASIAEDIPF